MSTSSGSGSRARLHGLLSGLREELIGFLAQRAGPQLLRFEAAEDLAQGLIAELLGRNSSPPREADDARAWAFGAARRYAAERRRHWGALKRDGGRVLRFAAADETRTLGPMLDPAASQTGPSTFAWRREQLVLAARAISLLLPRDRELVELASRGATNEEVAQELGLSTSAAARAKARALERLRKTHELVVRSLGS